MQSEYADIDTDALEPASADLVKFGIGQPMRRPEDFRFVTGAGLYADDEESS